MCDNYKKILVIIAVLLCSLVSYPLAANGVRASYLYNLSNFTGIIPFTWVRVVADPGRNEVYVCDGGSIYVFNSTGMETYRFGEDPRLGYMYDVAALDNGDLLVLSHFSGSSAAALVRCDYRGEFLERRPLTGVPSDWGPFNPTRMVLRGENLYLVELSRMRVVVLDLKGSLMKSIDLAAKLKMNDREVANSGLGGFDVNHEGNVYFTITTLFKAFRLSADGRLESFGNRGGSPGKFGVIHGIAADKFGTIYVVDTLKCTVSAFDRDFNFLYEFGYRTNRPGGLVAPKEATVSADGRLFVTQQANRGVSVYRVISN